MVLPRVMAATRWLRRRKVQKILCKVSFLRISRGEAKKVQIAQEEYKLCERRSYFVINLYCCLYASHQLRVASSFEEARKDA